jgi:hypothetical protein
MIVDNKKKIELTITGIGIVVLIFLIAGHMTKPKVNRHVAKTEPDLALEAAKMATSEAGPGDDVKWGRDPFYMDTSNAKEQGIEDIVLNGVVSDKQNPYAIINNDIVKLGDKVNGMTVIEINEKNVVLDENGQRHTLELNAY